MLKDEYKSKKIPFKEICDKIKPGSRIFLSSGPALPIKTVIEILQSNHPNLQDLEIIHLITLGKYLSQGGDEFPKFRLKTFNVGESIIKDIQKGKVDFIPANLIEIPFIFASGAIGVDVAIIQTTPPDSRGFMSLGIAVDVASIVIRNASMVIAEVNPNVPATNGDTSIHIDQVNYIIESDVPLIERKRKKYDAIMKKIGWYISTLIEDKSTVVLHVGRIFDAIASHLKNKKNLKIYTHVVSDWIIDLAEAGVLSSERGMKNIAPVTTSYCYGSNELYKYVDRNPIFEFVPLMRIAYPTVLQSISRLVSIMNVKKIDISGESVLFHSGDSLLSGYETKFNFAAGAAFSRNGKAIVALRSMDQKGDSNIVINHTEDNERVRSTIGVTRHVVTEYGIANLFGKSIRERALAMIDIAHPDHREKLIEEAKTAGYLYPDQIYMLENSLRYPLSLEKLETFKGVLEIKFRPIKASDEDMMRRLFYQFSDESKYLRYFSNIRTMPHRQMQKYVNIDYKNTLSIVGLIRNWGTEQIIAEGRYSYDSEDDSYEMAFIVDEDFQGKGIATFLLNYLITIAKDRGIKRLSANVLPQNNKMLGVFNKADAEVTTHFEEGVIHYLFKLMSGFKGPEEGG